MLRHLLNCVRGTSAIEAALTIPVLVALLLGGIYASMLAFNFVNLHFAVEAAARCAAVRTTVCVDAATTASYAQSQFVGTGITPVFTSSSASCGSQVTGTASFTMYAFYNTYTVPLSVTACYP